MAISSLTRRTETLGHGTYHPGALPQLIAAEPIWFITRRAGRDRTTGVVCQPNQLAVAREIVHDALAIPASAGLARGKLVVVDSVGPSLYVEQISRTREPKLVACAHASAAGALLLAGGSVRVRLPGALVEASFSVMSDGSVEGSWRLDLPSLSEIDVHGTRVLQLDALNTYRLIEASTDLDVRTEMEAWVRLSSTNKFAVIVDGGQTITFHNADGIHNSAPLTGLITVALARAMAAIDTPDVVTVRGEAEALPTIVIAPEGAYVTLPSCSVRFSRHETESAW